MASPQALCTKPTAGRLRAHFLGGTFPISVEVSLHKLHKLAASSAVHHARNRLGGTTMPTADHHAKLVFAGVASQGAGAVACWFRAQSRGAMHATDFI